MAKKKSPESKKERVYGLTGEAALKAEASIAKEVMRTMPRMEAIRWIEGSSKGRIFAASIRTRIKKDLRYMVARWGVRGKKGGVLPYDPKAKKLTIVYDVQKGKHRALAWEGLRSILIAGLLYKIV